LWSPREALVNKCPDSFFCSSNLLPFGSPYSLHLTQLDHHTPRGTTCLTPFVFLGPCSSPSLFAFTQLGGVGFLLTPVFHGCHPPLPFFSPSRSEPLFFFFISPFSTIFVVLFFQIRFSLSCRRQLPCCLFLRQRPPPPFPLVFLCFSDFLCAACMIRLNIVEAFFSPAWSVRIPLQSSPIVPADFTPLSPLFFFTPFFFFFEIFS